MESSIESLVGKNMQQVNGMDGLFDRDEVVGLDERELVEMLPNVFCFPLLEERCGGRCEIDSVVEKSIS